MQSPSGEHVARPGLRAGLFVTFVVLAFLLSWYPFLLHLAGVKRAQGINPLGVLLAAAICSAIEGRDAVKRLLISIVKVKAPLICYAVALLLPVALLAVSAVITVLTGAARPAPAQLHAWPNIIDKFVFMLVFVGVGEEPGWRGFAIPQLQRRFSPVQATLVLAPVWLLWHVPLFGNEFTREQVPPFAITVFGGALVLTWLYNRSGGSVLLPILMHATANSVAAGYIFQMFHGADLTHMWWIYAAAWGIVGGSFAVLMREEKTPAKLCRAGSLT